MFTNTALIDVAGQNNVTFKGKHLLSDKKWFVALKRLGLVMRKLAHKTAEEINIKKWFIRDEENRDDGFWNASGKVDGVTFITDDDRDLLIVFMTSLPELLKEHI